MIFQDITENYKSKKKIFVCSFDGRMDQKPFVIQCRRCRVILADSFSCVNVNTTILTFRTAQHVKKSAEVRHQDGLSLVDCTCVNCQTVLGFYATATSYHRDELRDHYNFYRDQILAYEIGTPTESVHPGETFDVKLKKTQEQVQSLTQELRGAQVLYISILERLDNLEAHIMK